MGKQKKTDLNLQIEYLDPNELKPYKKNARKHAKYDIEEIIKSINDCGFSDPIGIWGKENLIVEGHGRQLAAIQMGMTKVPCIRLDHMTDAERKEYAIRHNRTAELSEWDVEILKEEIADLKLDDIDLSDLNFDFLTDDTDPTKNGEVVEDEPVEPPEEPVAKPGDIYLLGKNRLMCGDSTNINDVKKLMDGNLADQFLTDPPYNVNYESKSNKLKIQNDNLDDANFRQFLVDAFTTADEVMKPGATFYIWHADAEGYNFRGACRDVGWTVRQCIIWNKSSFVIGRQDYHWKHEPCLYGWKEGAGHLWASDRKQTTVVEFDRPLKNDIHPTMKPVGLFDYLIKNNTKGGDIVLDLFSGSGTTIMACEQNGRVAYAMELDPRYVDATVARWEKFTGKKAVKISG